MSTSSIHRAVVLSAVGLSVLLLGAGPARAQVVPGSNCAEELPDHASLTDALVGAVAQSNGGLANDMWASIVNRDGIVCAVTFSGGDRGD